MTTEEARIIVLEDALIRAHSITEFLHNCLTNKETYIYQYPEHILKYIEYLESLITIPNLCYHSYYAPDRGQECKPCEENRERRIKLKEAKDVFEK
jgi:hypothetical protein